MPDHDAALADHLRTQKALLDEARVQDDGGLAPFLSTKPAGKLMSVYDLNDALRERRESVPETTTQHVRFDGFFNPDESDHDDARLAVGDRVRVSYAGSLGIPETGSFRPFYYGTIRSVEPWSDKLADMVFVSLDHAKRPEHGAWWERQRISKVGEQ
jgi:hypothetical protein